MPPSIPMCAASLGAGWPQAQQGRVRIQSLYSSSRAGPLRGGPGRELVPAHGEIFQRLFEDFAGMHRGKFHSLSRSVS